MIAGSRFMACVMVVLGSSSARGEGLALLGIEQAGPAELALIGREGGRPDPEIEDLVALARRTRNGRTEWSAGKKLSEARNAHSTNTKEQMKEALEHGYNFLEGDLRQEINEPHALEMRHDKAHESGDNLTFKQWLEIGKAGGRGLKIDVKEPEHMARVLTDVAAAGVPEELLMFNLGFSSMDEWGQRIRARFPASRLAFNPPSGEGKLSDSRIDGLLQQAARFGLPATFVVRIDDLTRTAIQRLEAVAPVSVWNSPYEGRKVGDPSALASQLRKLGVTGVIDLRKSEGLLGRASHVLQGGLNIARTKLDEGLDAAGDFIGNVAGGVGSLLGL